METRSSKFQMTEEELEDANIPDKWLGPGHDNVASTLEDLGFDAARCDIDRVD